MRLNQRKERAHASAERRARSAGWTALGMLAAAPALADDLVGVNELLCAASRVMVCLESGECYPADTWEADIPPFVVIDTGAMKISTTLASERPRSTAIETYRREGGLIYLQGFEAGRAFSFVIDEATGILTVAVSRDGLSVNIFGACTDANVQTPG